MTRTGAGGGAAVATAGAVVLPLALAQFIASYAASNMNVAISTIAADLDTDVTGIQTTITLFTLTMAALMIPGSKLTDIFGRKSCFILGLIVYGAGALLAALAQGLGMLTIGYSLLEGVGSALMIPPIYILITVVFDDLKTRAKWFGVVSGAAGLGSATGPLIGGLITSSVSWRASFLLQVRGRRRDRAPRPAHHRPAAAGRAPPGVRRAGRGPVGRRALPRRLRDPADQHVRVGRGPRVALRRRSASSSWRASSVYARARERGGRTPLVSPSLFRNRTSNLGLVTQHVQWLVLQGVFFVISVFLQQERGYSAIQTGLMLVPATIGILLSSGMAQRMASRHPQRLLVRAGFTVTVVGIAPAAGPRPGGLGELDLLPRPVPHGLRRRGHADRVGQRGAVRVAGRGPGRHLRRLPQRVEPRLVAGRGDRRVRARRGDRGGNAPFFTAIVVVGAFAIVGWVAALCSSRRTQSGAPGA